MQGCLVIELEVLFSHKDQTTAGSQSCKALCRVIGVGVFSLFRCELWSQNKYFWESRLNHGGLKNMDLKSAMGM